MMVLYHNDEMPKPMVKLLAAGANVNCCFTAIITYSVG